MCRYDTVNVKNCTVSALVYCADTGVVMIVCTSVVEYRNDPKFSDRYAWANSADPDRTAPQGLHCLPFRLRRLDSLPYGRTT